MSYSERVKRSIYNRSFKITILRRCKSLKFTERPHVQFLPSQSERYLSRHIIPLFKTSTSSFQLPVIVSGVRETCKVFETPQRVKMIYYLRVFRETEERKDIVVKLKSLQKKGRLVRSNTALILPFLRHNSKSPRDVHG